ncbi:MAG: hypothetical protein Phyf2KO_24880 [Phycisphaerales bacterium]
MPFHRTRNTTTVLGLLAFAANATGQTVIYVDDDAPAGGDGTSWQSAFRYLSDALEASAVLPDDNTIKVAGGVYRPDQSSANPLGSGETCATFFIPDGDDAGDVVIEGGYRGIGLLGDPDDRDSDYFATVLSGDLAGNDPQWPFDPYAVEWDDNTAVLLSASKGPVRLDGLRCRGARHAFYDGGRNLIDTTGVRWWARDVHINDCVFSDSAIRTFLFGQDCDPYSVQDGYGLYFGHFLGEHRSNPNTSVVLQDVSFERVSNLEERPLVYFGSGNHSWQGGGMTDCVVLQGVEAHTFNGSLATSVVLDGLVFDQIATPEDSFAEAHLVLFYQGTESFVRNCEFRNIQIGNVFGDAVEVLGLEQTGVANNTSVPKLVEDCVFDGIQAEIASSQSPCGLICSGATQVSGTSFRNISSPREAVLVAHTVDACEFTGLNLVSNDNSHDLRDTTWIIDGQENVMQDHTAAVKAFVVTNVLVTDVDSEWPLVEVADYASNCFVDGVSLISNTHAPFGCAPLVGLENAVIRDVTVTGTLLDDIDFRHNDFYGTSLGVAINSGAVLANSTITNNIVDSVRQHYDLASAVLMNRGATIQGCVITNNGAPVRPDGEPGHVAVLSRAFGESAEIIGLTICGNFGNHVAGIETDVSTSSGNHLRVINCVVANNSLINPPGPTSNCGDIHSQSFVYPCEHYFVEVSSTLTTEHVPLFVDAAAGNYRPAPNSPAIDAGDTALVPPDIFDLDNDGDTTEPTPFDFDGNPRILDDAGTPGFAVDIGAYEFQGTSCLPDVNNDGSLTPTDFTAWINAYNNNLPGCDQNSDGSCTPTDFTAWISNFNAGC